MAKPSDSIQNVSPISIIAPIPLHQVIERLESKRQRTRPLWTHEVFFKRLVGTIKSRDKSTFEFRMYYIGRGDFSGHPNVEIIGVLEPGKEKDTLVSGQIVLYPKRWKSAVLRNLGILFLALVFFSLLSALGISLACAFVVVLFTIIFATYDIVYTYLHKRIQAIDAIELVWVLEDILLLNAFRK